MLSKCCPLADVVDTLFKLSLMASLSSKKVVIRDAIAEESACARIGLLTTTLKAGSEGSFSG